MRISDWSSDVCASDLVVRGQDDEADSLSDRPVVEGERRAGELDRGHGHGLAVPSAEPAEAAFERAKAADRDQADDEEEDADERHRLEIAVAEVGEAARLVPSVQDRDRGSEQRILEHG